jgi:hypothetical protein
MVAAARQQALPEDGLNRLPCGAVVQDGRWSSFRPVTLHLKRMTLTSADPVSARRELKALLVARCHQRRKFLR